MTKKFSDVCQSRLTNTVSYYRKKPSKSLSWRKQFQTDISFQKHHYLFLLFGNTCTGTATRTDF